MYSHESSHDRPVVRLVAERAEQTHLLEEAAGQARVHVRLARHRVRLALIRLVVTAAAAAAAAGGVVRDAVARDFRFQTH